MHENAVEGSCMFYETIFTRETWAQSRPRLNARGRWAR
jgi:hypothetical protein